MDPPRLKPLLSLAKEGCLAEAQKFFLLAYAYREESLMESRRLLARADKKLEECEEPVLRLRINKLKSSAP